MNDHKGNEQLTLFEKKNVISVPKFASAFTDYKVMVVIQGLSEATDEKISNILEYDGCPTKITFLANMSSNPVSIIGITSSTVFFSSFFNFFKSNSI